jgi:hypothetical protein
MFNVKHAHKIVKGKPKGNTATDRRRWEDNIIIYLKDVILRLFKDAFNCSDYTPSDVNNELNVSGRKRSWPGNIPTFTWSD